MRRLAVVASLALAAAPAAGRAESPVWGSFELGAGRYRPNVDAQPGLTAPLPFGDIFGTGRGWMFRVGISRAILTSAGTLEAGFRTGYFRESGSALEIVNGQIAETRSGDKTTFNIIPTSLVLTYRFDVFAERVPLVPYGRVALERYNWWIGSGSSAIAKKGATNGYSATGGIALLVDWFDRGLARELDNDTGINHTYLFFDATKTWVKDFGSSSSWDLSDDELSLAFGMMFVF